MKIALVLLLVASTAVAQTSDSAIAEAVTLMDSGHIDEAIAKLKQVLVDEPSSVSARYELALAYSQKGEAALCRDTVQPITSTAGPLQAGALTTLATCFDQLGDSKKAIEAYRRALRLAPDDAQVNFNLAVTLAQNGNLPEAREIAKHGAEKNPWHASAHLLLAKVFDAEGFMVPAAYSYMHFLALEPVSPRATEAATALRELLGRGLKKTAEGGNITIDPNAPKDEGDFTPLALGIAMAAAVQTTEENVNKSEFEHLRSMLVHDVKIFIEMNEKTSGNYTIDVHRPFFTAMDRANVLDAFAATAISSLHLPGAEEWAKANEKSMEAYLDWIRPQRRPPAIALPAKQ
jgi:Tfp pilus assembly protein PilF